MRIAPAPSAPLWPPSGVPRSVAAAGVTVSEEGSSMAELRTRTRSTLAGFMVPAGAVDFRQTDAHDQERSAAGQRAAMPGGEDERAAPRGARAGRKQFSASTTQEEARKGVWAGDKPFDDWGLELPEMLLEPERASHTWLHATLKEGERMRLRIATLGTWGGSGRAVGAALRG